MRLFWRYIRLYSCFFRNCLVREMEARGSFVAGCILIMFTFIFPLLFIGAIYSQVPTLGGWTFYQYLVLVGTFQITSGLLFGIFAQNIFGMQDYVRKGELDFFLLKPVNSQFMLTTRYVRFNELPAALPGIVMLIVGIINAHLQIAWWQWLLYPIFIACGLIICYALWFITVIPVIWVVRLETADLFSSFFDISRYHPSMFSGIIKSVLVYVLPIGIVVSTPADVITNRITLGEACWAVLVAAILLFISNIFWKFAQNHYYGASS